MLMMPCLAVGMQVNSVHTCTALLCCGRRYVGEVTRVDATLLRSLVSSGYIPVVATVATDETGQALNVNADTAAGEIAAALQAEKLILMTDVPGVLRDKDDVTTKFATLNIKRSRELVQEGIIAGGMIPKVRRCACNYMHPGMLSVEDEE